jgi:hypothetical protein
MNWRVDACQAGGKKGAVSRFCMPYRALNHAPAQAELARTAIETVARAAPLEPPVSGDSGLQPHRRIHTHGAASVIKNTVQINSILLKSRLELRQAAGSS